MDDSSRWAADDDLPEITDDTVGSVFVDKYEMVWVCTYVEAAECFAWVQLGRA